MIARLSVALLTRGLWELQAQNSTRIGNFPALEMKGGQLSIAWVNFGTCSDCLYFWSL